MSKNKTIRQIWCDSCNQPRDHSIEYKGTNGNKVHFDSTCLCCTGRNEETKPVRQTVSLNDYNALIGREIYDKV